MKEGRKVGKNMGRTDISRREAQKGRKERIREELTLAEGNGRKKERKNRKNKGRRGNERN